MCPQSEVPDTLPTIEPQPYQVRQRVAVPTRLGPDEKRPRSPQRFGDRLSAQVILDLLKSRYGGRGFVGSLLGLGYLPGQKIALCRSSVLRFPYQRFPSRAIQSKILDSQVIRRGRHEEIMSHRRRRRIGAVTYLNTEPLVYGLAERAVDSELEFDVPSRLAARLEDRSLDVALIPTASFFRGIDYQMVSDACIACRGPVWSVKLLSRVPCAEIRTLAVDEGSATSVVLAQILLHRRHGVRPILEPFPLGTELTDTTADAVVMIGDRAMSESPVEFVEVWDLGDVWFRWSELPFVFAIWAARNGTSSDGLDAALTSARDRGVQHLDAVAQAAALRRGLLVADCYRYLAHHLHFRLGDQERKGMSLFYREAVRLGLAPTGQEQRLEYGCEVAQ